MRKYGIWDRPFGKNEIGKFLKDAFASAKLDETNKKKVSNHSVRKTSVGRLLEADVQPNFVAQLSGHKNLKSLVSYHSASLKRQREMSTVLNHTGVDQIHPLSSKKTKSVPPLQLSKMSSQSNKSNLRQFLPEHILTSLKVAHLTLTFSVVISQRSQG